MSNAFNPFQPPPATAPVAQPQKPAAAAPSNFQQRPIPKTFADVTSQPEYTGYGPPRFYEQPGEFDLQVLGYVADTGEKEGPRIQITVKVLTSTNPAVAVGFEGRIAYKYDHEKNQRSLLDTYGKDIERVVGFIAALYNKPRGQVTLADEAALRTNDWSVNPGFVHLSAKLGPPADSKKTPGAKVQFRRDTWFPAKAG
jgi:hypothetical protein